MKSLSPLHQVVLSRYAKTLENGQYDLAERFSVHYVTLSRWLNGGGCSQYEECTELAQRQLLLHPEWGDDLEARLMRKAQRRLDCTPQQARVIASLLITP